MLKINELSRLHLGVEKENLSRTIEIDMSAWAQTYPNATVEILHRRHGDQTKALVTGAEYDSETMLLSWTPTEYDTYYEGFGVAEIRMKEGEVVKKTKDLIITAVCPSVIDGSGSVVASNYQAFLNSVIGYKNDAQTAAAAAEAAAVHGPYIDDETGNWFVWDAEEEEYVNTGIHAQGPPGSIDNVYATGIAMSSTDPTTVKQAMDSKADASAIPTKTSQLTNDSGFLTQHQDISGKADKDTDAVTGNFAAFDASGNPVDSGHKHSDYLTQHQDISGKLDKDQGSGNAGKFMKVGSDGLLTPDEVPDPTGKADKVTGATSGNFAGLDSNGNLTDSGHKHGDYLTSHQDISGKLDSDNVAEEYSSSKTYAVGDLCIHNGKLYRATVASISAPWSDLSWTQTDVETELNEKTGKISGGTTGNLVGIGSGGVLTDSGSKPSDFLTQHQDISGKLDKNQGSGNAGKFMKVGSNGLLVPTPISLSGKADKVSSAVSGNLAGLDGNGNLTDSGHSFSDFTSTDIGLTIEPTDWYPSSPYTYTWTDSRVTAGCSVNVFFDEGADLCEVGYLEFTKVYGGIYFTADVLPTVDLPIIIRISNADAIQVADTSADMVSTEAISGVSNVEAALGVLNSKITTLQDIDVSLTDADNALEPLRTYMLPDNGSHVPNSSYYWAITCLWHRLSGAGDRALQLAFPYATNDPANYEMYVRSKNNTWGAWKRITLI